MSERAVPGIYPVVFRSEPSRTYMLTDIAWGQHVGCDDQPKGEIGLYTLLRLVAHYGGHIDTGYAVSDPENNSVVKALRQADPTMKHWHMHTNKHGLVTIWRRKEWNEAYEKQQLDEAKKVVIYENESLYQADKESVMDLLMVLCNDNRREAERLFAPMANDRAKLKAKADSMRRVQQIREAKRKIGE